MFSSKIFKQSLFFTMTIFLGTLVSTHVYAQIKSDIFCDPSNQCEATGVNTRPVLNGPGYPDGTNPQTHVWSNDLPEAGLPLGAHTVTWTLKNLSNDAEVGTETQNITIVDTTDPYFNMLPFPMPFLAQDFLTTLTPEFLGFTLTATDAVDANPTVTLLGASDASDASQMQMLPEGVDVERTYTLKVRTGTYKVYWQAEDSSGNIQIVSHKVTIIPVASMLPSPTAVIGGKATFTVVLNGAPVAGYFPLVDERNADTPEVAAKQLMAPGTTVKVKLTGTVVDKIYDHMGNPKSALKTAQPAAKSEVFDYDDDTVYLNFSLDQTSATGDFIIPDGLDITPSDTLIATIDSEFYTAAVEIGLVDSTSIPLTDQNIAPRFELRSYESIGDSQFYGTTFSKASDNSVVIHADVIDEDDVTLDWDVSGAQFAGGPCNCISFIPNDATSNIVTVTLTATDTGGLVTTKSLDFVLTTAAPPALYDGPDTDGDGDNDASEGFGDSDGDGIADYLDNDPHVNQLPLGDNNDPMFVKPGITLTLGSTKRSADSYTAADATVSDDNLQNHADAGGNAPNNTNDSDHPVANRISPVIDFEVSGFVAGETIDIVIPLPLDASIPENAVYRKYTVANGWRDFRVNAGNALASAPLTSNVTCPAADSADYTSGLTVGDQCIRLSIEDGGPNDADAEANGVIVDPGVLTVPTPVVTATPDEAVAPVSTSTTTTTTTTTPGGSDGGSSGLLMLLLLPLTLFRIRKIKSRI